MFPTWTYLGYFAWSLKGRLGAFKKQMEGNWVFNNVMSASTGVGIMYFLFGNY